METGDIVKLKSGGPDMTISLTYDGNFREIMTKMAECKWFDTKGNLLKDIFPINSLELKK